MKHRFNPLLSLWVYSLVQHEVGLYAGSRIPRHRLRWAISLAQAQLAKFNWSRETVRQVYYAGKRLHEQGYAHRVPGLEAETPELAKRVGRPVTRDQVQDHEMAALVEEKLRRGLSKRAAWREVGELFGVSASWVRKRVDHIWSQKPTEVCT